MKWIGGFPIGIDTSTRNSNKNPSYYAEAFKNEALSINRSKNYQRSSEFQVVLLYSRRPTLQRTKIIKTSEHLGRTSLFCVATLNQKELISSVASPSSQLFTSKNIRYCITKKSRVKIIDDVVKETSENRREEKKKRKFGSVLFWQRKKV